MRRRRGPVRLSTHAFERWKLRVSENAKKKEVVNQIKARIAFELKNGADVNRRGALEIEIQPKIWAYCYPSLMGGWDVATIIREGWNGDMEERAKYGGGSGDERNRELKAAIEYFKEVIWGTNETINDFDCSQGLREKLLEQKEYFTIALEALRKEAKEA